MTSAELFAEELCGITPQEVAGLLNALMRPEFKVFSNRTGKKLVRKWKGDMLGNEVLITEINNHSLAGFPKPGGGRHDFDFFMGVDFHVETIEWEFKVRVDEPSSINEDTSGLVKIGGRDGRLSCPWFEGDVDDYRRDMSIIRLMCL